MSAGLLVPAVIIVLLATVAFFGFRLGVADWGKADTPVGLFERAFGFAVGGGAIAMIPAMFVLGAALMD